MTRNLVEKKKRKEKKEARLIYRESYEKIFLTASIKKCLLASFEMESGVDSCQWHGVVVALQVSVSAIRDRFPLRRVGKSQSAIKAS